MFLLFFAVDLNPRGSVPREKLPVASFRHRAAQTGTVALRRSASHKYAKYMVKSVYQLQNNRNIIFGVPIFFLYLIFCTSSTTSGTSSPPNKGDGKRTMYFYKKTAPFLQTESGAILLQIQLYRQLHNQAHNKAHQGFWCLSPHLFSFCERC